MVGAIFRTMHPKRRKMARPLIVQDCETVGIDTPNRRPQTTDPICEYAAVYVRRDFTVDLERSLHLYIRHPRVTRETFYSSWVYGHTNLRWKDVEKGVSPREAGHRIRHFHPQLRRTSFNRDFDDNVLSRQLDVEPNPATGLMVGSTDAWRAILAKTHGQQFWPGNYDTTFISCDRAVEIWRELGHDIPNWSDHG